jgi:hypothetical protein
MKYSQLIGVIAALIVITLCFFPWSYIASKDVVVSGLNAEGTRFGRPGLMNIIMSSIAIILFLIPRVWAKRFNTFITVFNFAWSIRNYIIISYCFMGECPEKKTSLYLLVTISFIVLVMALLPKLKLQPKAE